MVSDFIHTSNLIRKYPMGHGMITALRGINFVAEQNEFVVIMGSSGSGKSTLLHILGCLDRPDSGEYKLAGRNIFDMTDNALSLFRANYIGFVFQSFSLIPFMTVYENVELPFLYSRRQYHNLRPKIIDALERVGIADRCLHRPNELSGGELQRAAIARAIVTNPELILADEPTGNLDSETGSGILQVFKELHTSGATIIMVTHDPMVADIGQRIFRIQDGRSYH